MTQKDYLTLGEVAAYLGWSTRFVDGLVQGRKLPGLNINGEWRFRREEIIDWLNQKIQTLDAPRLNELEEQLERDLLKEGVFQTEKTSDRITPRLSPETIAVDISLTSKRSILDYLVSLANKTGLLVNPEHLLASLIERESLCSTAMPGGIAICHPRRPIPSAISDYIIACLRTKSPVPFGSDNGEPTQLFFLLCAYNDRTHLHGLARLARILDKDTIEKLKSPAINSPKMILEAIHTRESDVFGG